MGPKKGKGKAVVAQNPAGTQPAEQLAPALIGTELLHRRGTTVLKDVCFGRLTLGLYPFFAQTLFAGLVPPFSPFLEEILGFYQICLLHLHPKSVLILAIFAYLCEVYLGVAPYVAFFRNFYALRSMAPDERSGCLSFRIAVGMAGIYIPMAWDANDKPVMRVTKKVEDFRLKWLLVDIRESSNFCDIP